MSAQRCIACAFLLAVTTVPLWGHAEVSIQVEAPQPPPPETILALLEARSPTGQTATLRFKVPGSAGLDLDPIVDWTLSVSAPDYWAPTRVLRPGQSAITLELFPAGSVASAIRTQPGEEMPTDLRLLLRDPRATDVVLTGNVGAPMPSPDLPEVAVTCPVVEGLWSCMVPAGVWDLRVRARGFLSHYFWDLKVPAGATAQLKPLQLERGASLIGRVETEEGVLPESTVVRLSPSLAHEPETQGDLLLFKSRTLETGLEHEGFFIFAGIPPGSYRLTASASGFVDAVVPSAPVLDNAETEIAVPLTLRRPITADFVVVPPLDPQDLQWTASLVRRLDIPGRVDAVGDYVVGEDGTFTVERLAPGDYSVALIDGSSNRFARLEVTIAGEGGVTVLEAPGVPVEGTVSLGDSPLSADVYFGGTRGGESVRMSADEEGSFAGYLPREGLWIVEVVASDLGVNRRFQDVSVRPGKDGVADVELTLPDTFLQGRVVDDQATPVPGAQVVVTELTSRALVRDRVDDGGEFSFLGLAEGPVSLEAEASVGGETLAASMRIVTLSEDVDPGFQELVLHRMVDVSGRVVSAASTGVPGAWIVGQATPTNGIGLISVTTAANVDGAFTLRVPADTAVVDVWAMPIGCSLTHSRIDIADGTEVTIQCNDDSGTLEIRYPPDLSAEEKSRLLLAVTLDGVLLDLQMLKRWTQFNATPGAATEERFLVPQMPAGNYALCLLDAAGGTELLMTGRHTSSRCTSGFLGRYGELALEVPE
jgi:Carboxypeptidase regulatory-like domain